MEKLIGWFFTPLNDKVLINNGFKYDGGQYVITYHNSIGFLRLEAMKIDEGYWMSLSMRQSGKETGRIMLGQYLYKHELKKLKRVLSIGR